MEKLKLKRNSQRNLQAQLKTSLPVSIIREANTRPKFLLEL